MPSTAPVLGGGQSGRPPRERSRWSPEIHDSSSVEHLAKPGGFEPDDQFHPRTCTTFGAVCRDELETSRFACHWTHRGACDAEEIKDDFMARREAVDDIGGGFVAVVEAVDQDPRRRRGVPDLHGWIMVRFRLTKKCNKKSGSAGKTRRQPADLWVESNACNYLPRGSAFQETARMLFMTFSHTRSNTCPSQLT